MELQAILYQILQENTKPTDLNKPQGAEQEPLQYEELSKKEKPQDRIRSAYDPEIRSGYKSKTSQFTGDKVQAIESRQHGLILNTEPIPGNGWDGDRLVPMVEEVINRHGIVPKQVVGDTTAMVINLKIIVKELAEPIKPFYRYKKCENRVKAPVCPN